MKISFYLLLGLLGPRKTHSVENPQLDKFLEERSVSVQQRLMANFEAYEQTDDEGIMHRATLQLPRNSEEIHEPSINIFTLFNTTFFLIDNSIFRENKSDGLIMEPYGDFEHEKSNFFKSFEYHQTGFFAFSSTFEIKFYLLNETGITPELTQQLWSPFTSDGLFFASGNNLYFVSSSSMTDQIGHLTFYKWMGSYFDHIAEVQTIGVTRLGSFPYKKSEIIIAERHLAGIKLRSSVYEFKHDQVRKIQELDTHNPIHMTIFFQNNVPYVLIYEESNRQQLFKWTGFEVVAVNSFQWKHRVDKSMVVYSNSTPLIVQPQLEKVLIFKVQNDDIVLYQTRKYVEQFSIISDINKGQNENGNIAFIAGLSEDYMINIYKMYLEAHAEMEREQGETLRKCFNNLQEKVYDRSSKLNQANVHSKSRNRRTTVVSNINDTDLTIQFNNLDNRLNRIKKLINNPENFSNEFVVDEKAFIKGSIKAKNIIGNNLKFNTINGKRWTPESWLQSNGTQVITGAVWIKNLKTKILVANGTANIFKDFMRSNSSQKITGKFKIKNLVASDISTKIINNIEVDNIYKKNDSDIIKGVKSFKNISAKNSTVTKINGENVQNIFERFNQANKLVFAPHVIIENLEVESLDNITWSDFENTVFKIGKDDTIHGNISGPKFSTTHLRARIINGVNPNNLMTTSTSQIVNSTLKFNNIKASNINSEMVNGQSTDNFVQIDQNIRVKGPVQIQHITIENNKELRNNDSSLFVMKDNDIFGTNETDLQQRFLGKVIIHGNLYVTDFSVFPNTTLTVKGNKYKIETLNEYWTKDGNQTIPVHLEARKGILVPDLQTKYVNNIPIEQFAVNSNTTQIKGPLIFENVTVRGNVVLQKTATTESFNLTKLASEGVKNNRKKYRIKGKKTFRNMLVANRLKVSDNFTLHSNNLTGSSKFRKIIVEGDLIGDVYTDLINNINITKFIKSLVPLDRPQNLTNMAFKKVAVENLRVEKINGINVAEYLSKLRNLQEMKRFVQITVKGNITLEQIQDLNTINGHNIQQLLEKDFPQMDQELNLLGDVNFTGKVSVANLKTRIINGVDFPNITRRHFHKYSNQTVYGIYSFNNLKTKDLYAKRINEKNVENLIDISAQKTQYISAPAGITLKDANFEKSVKAEAMSPCNIYKAMDNIRYPQTQEWSLVEIIGNVTFLDNSCDLMRIIEKTVKRNKQNIVVAPVHIKGHVRADHVRIENLLNSINLTELINDVVLKDSDEEQVITGHKIFRHHITADYATVTENADIPIVNNMYIPELYKRIIKRDEIRNITIFGSKTFFGGFQAEALFSENIGRVKPESIVTLSNLSEVPNAIFDYIEIINDLSVQHINNYNISDVFTNRVLVDSIHKQIINSVCYFNDIEVAGDLKTPLINNVNLKNVIFDVDQQKIASFKKFYQNIIIFGGAKIENINGINITEAYNNAMLHGDTEIINGSVTMLDSVKFNGNITAQTINGYPIEQIQEIINSTANKIEERAISLMRNKIKIIVEESLPKVKNMTKELMYLQKSEDLQIGIQNAVDARVTVIKGYALIHIISEESHLKCHLSEGCKCLVQHSVEVTPHLSVAAILNEAHQRIYSYDDESITIHVQTNSISTDKLCRRDTLDEFSTMTWGTSTSNNITGESNMYPTFFTGYLSGAEFFTLGEVTYAILALYYDPIADTHNLNCTLIRFSEDKTSASEIQQIQTHGAWTLHLLHTAQGVIMIIGNLVGEPSTNIYRFNEEREKFELLRSVSFGCTKAAGVVLGTDSLIILANQDAPLQVLRYHPGFDNYYYYQMLAFDEHVLGVSVFYIGDSGIIDAYLCIVTEDNYRIYSFQYIDGWKLESRGLIRGLRNLIPFEIEHQKYLFAASTNKSSLLKVAEYGRAKT